MAAPKPDPDHSGKTVGNDASETRQSRTLPKTWYISLLILTIITFLGLITVYLLVLLVPSEIKLEIKKAGTAITIVGGAGLFIILLKIYLGAYEKIVKTLLLLLACFVFFIPLITIFDLKREPAKPRFEHRIKLGRLGPEGYASFEFDDYGLLSNEIFSSNALKIIGTLGTEPLIKALDDKDIEIRKSALWALGKIKDPAALPALIKTFTDKDEEIRFRAAMAIASIGGPMAIKALIEALKHQDYRVRLAAAWALGKIDPKALQKIGGPSAVTALIEALKDEDTFVRVAVALSLEKINTPEARKAFEEYKQKSK